jgi:hypothetical protein
MIKSLPIRILYFFLICLLSQSCDFFPSEQVEYQDDPELRILYPAGETELVGGQSFRITLYLTDNKNQPIAGASTEVELRNPDGDIFRTLKCVDKDDGRYLTDPATLPLKNTQGTWQVTARAMIKEDLIVQSKGQFIGQQSYSERIQDLFGFWIEISDPFSYYIPNAEDPRLKTYQYENGGYLILANNMRTGVLDSPFVILDVHWQHKEFPEDHKAAIDHILSLAGPHRITIDISAADLEAEQDSLQNWPAWRISGLWYRNDALGNPLHAVPLDWMSFKCPGSDWLWTILITSNEINYLNELELIRETFSCSPK